MVYFITFSCHGLRLPGDPRGTRDHVRNGERRWIPPNAGLESYHREAMLDDAYVLSTSLTRQLVKESIIEVCKYCGWKLIALHVRTTHIHAVVNAEATSRRIAIDWKAYTTRRLRVDEPTRMVYWAQGGSARALKTERDVRRAVAYVLEEQGQPLETFCAE